MIHPRIDELLDNVDSRYALVIVAAKRARQINDYHHQLGEGIGFENAPPPLVESRSKNYLTMALEEVAEGKMKYKYPKLVVLRYVRRFAGNARGLSPRALSAGWPASSSVRCGEAPRRRSASVRLRLSRLRLAYPPALGEFAGRAF